MKVVQNHVTAEQEYPDPQGETQRAARNALTKKSSKDSANQASLYEVIEKRQVSTQREPMCSASK